MSIELKEVVSRKELKQFIRFPFQHYQDDNYWVPPMIRGEMETLSSGSNPAFEHCETIMLMALCNGEPAGRIGGIINHRYIKQWERKHARFCWFETTDDREVSAALLGAVETWAREKGMERLVGPMGFTTFERQGILVKGFDEMPTIAGVHNPAYYPEHLEALGYSKEIDYVEFELKVPDNIPEKIIRIRDVVMERYGLKILRAKTIREMLPYADPVFRVINEAYRPLYGFAELTEKQIAFFVRKYFSFLKPDFTTAVLDKNDNVIGFQISMPSLSRAMQKAGGRLYPFGWYYLMRAMKKPKKIDAMLVGVHPDYQSKGINSVFMVDLTSAAIRNGVKYAESNNELEENLKVQSIWRHFESRQHRRSRIYGKSLQ